MIEHNSEIKPRPIRVCYFGTYRAEYSRNRIMIEGLRRNGVEVVTCQAPIWTGIDDRVNAAIGGWARPAFWLRVIRTYLRLLRQYGKVGPYDCMVVGYPGQFDVFLARVLSWRRRRPLVWDIFMSIYLIAVERELAKRSRFTLAAIKLVERLACRLPDLLILDTSEYVSWFGLTHGVPPERFQLVPTGADGDVFRPIPCSTLSDGLFRVLYYGTFIPNHGVEYIIEAARILSKEPAIRFELIGEGPDLPKAQALAQQYGLTNVEFVRWLDQAALVERVACADVCLGAFGTTPQSLMTVQNKIYEGMAMGKPVITGDSPAVRQALRHGEQIYLCRRADGADLAAALSRLHADPDLCVRLAKNGWRSFVENFTTVHIGERFSGHLASLSQGGVA